MMNNRRCDKSWKIIIAFVFCAVILSGCQKSDEAGLTETTTPTQAEKVVNEPKDTVIIVTSEYIPYTTASKENMGFLTEMMEAVLEDSGIKYKISFYPWQRCLEMVKNGEAWASFPYGYSEEKAAVYDFSATIITSKHRFYYYKENEKIKEEVMEFTAISDFTDYIFGGANGYWYGRKSDFMNLGVKVEWANDTDALIKMLHSERIDFFIEDELVCDEAIARLFPEDADNFEKLPKDAKIQK
ncbi:MAG: transporter substrate-binding domain-containing protein, partial [Mobilitalea sp.]